MEPRRVVEVFASSSGQRKRGTGYVIAPKLVLTSRHVLADGGRCEVAVIDDQTRAIEAWIEAKIAWIGTNTDAALLEPFTAGQEFMRAVEPVALGAPSGRIPVPVEAIGFPAAVAEGAHTKSFPITGTCHPRTPKDSRLLITLAGSAPADRTGWAGVSGSSVFAGDVLVGVLEAVARGFDSNTLEAVPIEFLLEDATFKKAMLDRGIDTRQTFVDADDVGRLPSAWWWDIAEAYRARVVSELCQFDLTGVSADNATMQPQRGPESVFRGIHASVPGDQAAFDLAQLAKRPATVLTGAPGSGKSGALKLLLDLAAQEKKTPLYFPLRELAAAPKLTSYTLITYLAEQAVEQLDQPKASSPFFRAQLGRGECVVGFDGLDEIQSRPKRSEAALAIRAFCDDFPRNRFIVTSRPVEYQETPIAVPTSELAPRFEHLELAPFNASDVRELLRTCFGDDGKLADRITADPNVASLATNPLHISLLAVCAKQGELPSDLLGLLDKFVETAIGGWDELKVAAPGTVQLRRAAIERLARAELESNGSAFFEDQALRALSPLFVGQGASGQARDVLGWLERRSGLLRRKVQKGMRVDRVSYDFGHQQLREYLTGCELAERYRTNPGEAFQGFRARLFDAGWRTALRFAVGSLSKSGDAHVELLRSVCDLDDRYEDLLHRKALLAGDLLALAEFIPEEMQKEVIGALERVAMEDCCLGSAAIERMLQLSPFEDARRVLHTIAGGGATKVEAEIYRVRAAIALHNHELSEGSVERLVLLLDAISERRAHRLLLQALVELGRQDEVADAALADLQEDESAWMLDEIRDLGLGELARRFALERLIPEVELDRRCRFAAWLWDEGAIDEHHPDLTDMFATAHADLLSAPPSTYEVSAAVRDACTLAHSVLERGPNAAARKLLDDALEHPALDWTTAMQLARTGVANDRSVLTALMRTVTGPVDNSRRRIVARQIIEDRDDTRVVPVLLDLLRSERSLRWTGAMLIESLAERGRTVEAIATLESVAANTDASPSIRLQAAHALSDLDPGLGTARLAEVLRSTGDDVEQTAKKVVAVLDDGAWMPGDGETIYRLFSYIMSGPGGPELVEAIHAAADQKPRVRERAESVRLLGLEESSEIEPGRFRGYSERVQLWLLQKLAKAGSTAHAVELAKELAPRAKLYFAERIAGEYPIEAGAISRSVLADEEIDAALRIASAELLLHQFGAASLKTELPILRKIAHAIPEAAAVDIACLLYASGQREEALTIISTTIAGTEGHADVLQTVLRQIRDRIPWQREWTDKIAEVVRRGGSDINGRCSFIEMLQRAVGSS